MPESGNVTNKNINGLISSVRLMTDDEQEQLSILANAFVIICKNSGVAKKHAADNIKKLFSHDHFHAPH